jgi:methylated-DNA-[protein]-cysteine S-methyltransferase
MSNRETIVLARPKRYRPRVLDLRRHAFETPLGWGELAFTARGIRTVRIGGRRPTPAAKRGEGRVPPFVREAARRIAGHLGGRLDDLQGIPLDLEGVPALHARIYEAARTIAPGAVLSYGAVAALAGASGAARAAGTAMARCPVPFIVPCHRVVGSSGRLGGWSSGGLREKVRLLSLEGVRVSPGGTVATHR